MTLTPVTGMSWTYDEIYAMKDVDEDIDVIEIQTYENPYIDMKEIERIEGRLGVEEKKMRLEGAYQRIMNSKPEETNKVIDNVVDTLTNKESEK